MRLLALRSCIQIIPESKIDEAYLEEVFGLRNEGDFIKAKRVNAIGLSCWAHLLLEKEKK